MLIYATYLGMYWNSQEPYGVELHVVEDSRISEYELHGNKSLGKMELIFPKDKRPAEISQFNIRENLRGHGLGTSLLMCVFQICRRASLPRVILYVSKNNERAQNLYFRHGFVVIGEGYKGLFDCLIMEKRL